MHRKIMLILLCAILSINIVNAQCHNLSVNCNPTYGGYTNITNSCLNEDSSVTVYAYPKTDFRFVCWKQNGIIVSTNNPLTIKMGNQAISYTAHFVYDPASPSNPGSNSVNYETGEIIIDDFIPGNLNSTIASLAAVIGMSNVRKISIFGQMNSFDFGFSMLYPNCEIVDISKTSGYYEVPDYAFGNGHNLKEIHIPSSVTNIGNQAFDGCDSLLALYCYAANPPTVTASSFANMPNKTVIYVPRISLQLYQQANYWNNHLIQSFDSLTSSLMVILPQIAASGKYRDMTLELRNLSTGQVSNLIVTNSAKYTFANIIRNTKCNVSVKNKASLTLGKISDINIVSSEDTVVFSSLLEPKSVRVNVTNPNGDLVNDSIDITWYDENGKYLGFGDSITNVLSGTRLKYKIGLSDDMTLKYVVPQDSFIVVCDSPNHYSRSLNRIASATVKGYVKENVTGKGINNVNVTILQKINKRQTKTVIVNTDRNGCYSATILNVSSSFSFASSDYVNHSMELCDFTGTSDTVLINDVLLNPITGTKAIINYTVERSRRLDDDTVIDNHISNVLDIDYSVYNVTADRALQETSLEYPILNIRNEINLGDSVNFTATSRRRTFTPVTVGVRLDTTGVFNITFPIVELGKISVSYNFSTNNDEVAMLFDASGNRVGTYSYDEDTLTISDLQNGIYSLVSMDRNDDYNNLVNIRRFDDLGLVAGQDYCKDTISVSEGVISVLRIDTIPYFNNLRYNLINRTNSYFSASQYSIVAGNYLTLTANVEIPDSNLRKISDAILVIDLPFSVGFVDKSVMTGNSVTQNYSFSGNSLTIPLTNVGRSNKIKFCVIPVTAGHFVANAMIQATDNDGAFMLAIGSAQFDVKDFSVVVPNLTSKPEIYVCGMSAPGAAVEIYDDNTLIGSCTSFQNGSWNALCQLNDAYNLSSHPIHAKVIIGDKYALSQTRTCIYNKDTIVQVSKVTMHHRNSFTGRNYEVVFDFQHPNTKPVSYSYYHDTRFTFNIDFTINDTSFVDFVTLWVLTNKGYWKSFNAEFDSTLGNWYTEGTFSTSDFGLPINVSVDYFPIRHFELDTTHVLSMFDDYQMMIDTLNESMSTFDNLMTQWENYESDSLNRDTAAINNLIRQLFDDIELTQEEQLLSDSLVAAMSMATSTQQFDMIFNDYINAYGAEIDSLWNDFITIDSYIPSLTIDGVNMPSITIQTNDTNSTIFNTDIRKVWTISNEDGSITTKSNGQISSDTSHVTVDNSNVVVLECDDKKIIICFPPEIRDTVSGMSSYRPTSTKLSPTRFAQADNNAFMAFYDAVYSSLTDCLIFDRIPQHLDDISDLLFSRNKVAVNTLINMKQMADNGMLDDNLARSIFAQQKKVAKYYKQLVPLRKVRKLGGFKGIASCISVLKSSFIDIPDFIKEANLASLKWDGLLSDLDIACNSTSKETLKKEIRAYQVQYNRESFFIGTTMTVMAIYSALDWYKIDYKKLEVPPAINPIFGITSSISTDYFKRLSTFTNERNFHNMVRKVRAEYKKCGTKYQGFQQVPDVETQPTSFLIDPSGFVYEGVSSNRLPGVTALCYYKDTVENIYGDLVEQAVLWDAEEFEQENPLLTDSNGFYQWFVPTGLWQVKYEKDGYETTYSDWLPVPPPQLEVNVAMTQNRQPVVASAHAYNSGIVVEFDKYMKPELLDTNNIHVKVGDTFVSGSIELLDEEVAYMDTTVRYASKIKFVPTSQFAESQVTLIVSNQVESYAGIKMQEAFIQTFTLEQEISSINADSVVNITMGNSVPVKVTTLPVGAASGKRLTVNNSSNAIAICDSSTYILDANGETTIMVAGRMLGVIGLELSIDESYATKTVIINVERSSAPVTIFTYDTICQGESYIWRGLSLSEENVYHDTVATGSNIDTVYVLNLTVNQIYYTRETSTIVEGASLQWHNQSLTTTGIYFDTMQTINGCDSVFEMTLTVGNTYLYSTEANICQGEAFTWRGHTYGNAGIYLDSLLTQLGYDSVYQLILTVNPTYFIQQNVHWPSGKGAYDWHDKLILTSGIYYDSLTTTNTGCDSVYMLDIIFIDPYHFNDTVVICEGDYYDWRNGRYTASGVYFDSLKTADDVDSVYQLNLLVNPVYQFIENDTINKGDTMTWHNLTLYESGVYYDSLISIFGCDSVFELTLCVTEMSSVDYVNENPHTISIVPNPVNKGMTAIIYGNITDVEYVQIVNESGQLVKTYIFTGYPIEIGNIQVPGLYFVKLLSKAGETIVSKFIVK